MRSCGPCTACCYVLGVIALGKGEWSRCSHQEPGCAIYADRPSGCSSYRCAWLDGKLPEDERPDVVGLIVDSGLTRSFLPLWGEDAVNVREVSPGAASGTGAKLVDRLVGEGAPVFLKLHGGGCVLRSNDSAVRAKFDRLVELKCEPVTESSDAP